MNNSTDLTEFLKFQIEHRELEPPEEEFKEVFESLKSIVNDACGALEKQDDQGLIVSFTKLADLHFDHIENIPFDSYGLYEHRLRKAIRDVIAELLRNTTLSEYEWDSGDEDEAYAGNPRGQFGFVKKRRAYKKRRRA
tara:strand:- start:239 stop:652 length:414 start_codon:yes stop_codon:yes gene_type:complete